MSGKTMTKEPELGEKVQQTKILTMELPWVLHAQKPTVAEGPPPALDEGDDLWDNVPI